MTARPQPHLATVIAVFARSLPAHTARPLNVLGIVKAPRPRPHPPLLLMFDAGAGEGRHLLARLVVLQLDVVRGEVLACQGIQERVTGGQGDQPPLGSHLASCQLPGARGEGVGGQDGRGGGQVQRLLVPVHRAAYGFQQARVSEGGGERLLDSQHVLVLPGEDVGGVRSAGDQPGLVHVQRNLLKHSKSPVNPWNLQGKKIMFIKVK